MNPHSTTRFLLALGCTSLLAAQSPLLFSSYFGGSAEDRAYGVARSPGGLLFVAGHGGSADLPVTDGSKLNGAADGFVACLDPQRRGSAQLLWCVRYGGAMDDQPLRLSLDPSSKRVTIVGRTNSTDLPVTAGAFQGVYGGGNSDGFVAQFDAGDGRLVYATYLGGSGEDWLCDVAVQGNGQVTAAGTTFSTDFPASANAFQPKLGGLADLVAARLDPTATGKGQLTWATHVGGSATEGMFFTYPNYILGHLGVGLHVDGGGLVTLASRSSSRDYPTSAGSFQPAHGGGATGTDFDACATRLDPKKSGAAQLVWSTFVGDVADDAAMAVGVNGAGEPMFAGYSGSANYPVTPGAYDTTYQGGTTDLVATRLSNDGKRLIASTFLGGTDREYPFGLALAPSGAVTITGYSFSTDMPGTVGAFQPKHAGPPFDGYLSQLTPDLGELRYSTLVGGDFNEPLIAVCDDCHGGAIAAGASTSYNFPVTGDAFQRTNLGLANACITHLDLLPHGVARQGARTTSNGARSVYQTVSEQPRAAAAKFRVICENAPAASSGLALAGAQHNGVIIAGIEVFLDLGSWLAPFAVTSNGLGAVELPLPASSATQGLKFATQFFWVEQARLIGSDGLFLTIQ